MKESELNEWREHPVTREIREALRRLLDQEHEAMTQAYWAGQAATDGRREGFLQKRALWEDIFEGSAAEFAVMTEDDDADA